MLSRELAAHNHYPAIDVLQSVSRLAQDLLDETQQGLTGSARDLMATYRKNQDLISIGAYEKGSNPGIDAAIQLHEPLNTFLKQDFRSSFTRDKSWEQLVNTLGSLQPVQTPSQMDAPPGAAALSTEPAMTQQEAAVSPMMRAMI